MANRKNKRKKKNKEEEISSVIACIPDDLLQEILCKLPVSSICRFRCVCKYWRDLFQDQHFIARTRTKPPYEFEIPRHKSLKYYTVVDESGFAIDEDKNHYIGRSNYRRCNNLICYQRDSTQFSVLDLSTGKRCILPPPPILFELICFNFEFGFDPYTKEYKVLAWAIREKKPYFYVLTLLLQERSSCSSWSWRKPPFSLRISNFFSLYEKTFATTTGMFYLVHDSKLISFNLSTEEFRIILLPPEVLESRRMAQAEFSGMLYSLFQPEVLESRIRMAQAEAELSGKSYSLFEYQGCLCWVQHLEKKVNRMKYLQITGMWMLKDYVDTKDYRWVKLMKDSISLSATIHPPSLSAGWLEKHSHFSSTTNGEIMITISTSKYIHILTKEAHEVVKSPCLLIYNFLDREFRTIKISVTHEVRSKGCRKESCKELQGHV